MDGFWEALGVLLQMAFLYALFIAARTVSEKANRWKACGFCIGLALFLGLMSYETIGTHVEDSDPLFGGGETIQDYAPTGQERSDGAVKVFTLVIICLGAGVYKSNGPRVCCSTSKTDLKSSSQ